MKAAGDEVTQRIGLRTLELVNREDKDGLSMEFMVNGRAIFAKGANWIPADALPQRVTREVLDDLLTSATEAHMNMLRVWGGGRYESDDFYDLCDEKGILIWQDFMFSCALYPATPAFLDNVREEARWQVKRLRNRTCLALWCRQQRECRRVEVVSGIAGKSRPLSGRLRSAERGRSRRDGARARPDADFLAEQSVRRPR